MLNIFIGTFEPNTAVGNRQISFVKGLLANGAEINLVLTRAYGPFPISDGLNINYLTGYGNSKLKRIISKITSRHRLQKYLDSGAITPNDPCIIYDIANFEIFASVNNLVYYHERTENPDVIGFGKRKATERRIRYMDFCRNAAGMFVISTNLRDFFIKEGIDPAKIHIVNMVVDPNRFDSLKNEQTEAYLAYCGTVSNTKDGVDDLLRSFAIIAPEYPNLKLYIIGAIPDKKEENSNIRLIEKLGISERVVLTGCVEAKEIPQLLYNAKALILARPDNLQARNGFPTKLGEYLMTGRPVIVTRTSDIPLFLDNKSAYLAEPGNPEDIAGMIRNVLRDYSQALKVGAEGKEIAEKSFSNIKESRKILDIITNDNL